MEYIEHITWNGEPLAYIVRRELNPKETTFLTPREFNLQLGFVVYPEGGEVPRHIHRPLARHITGTPEVLVLKSGRCFADIYNSEKELVATRELRKGDIILLVGGGHGFRMIEDTVFLEVKQGPFIELDEKIRF